MGIGLGIGINRSNYAQGIFNSYQSRVIADGGVTEAGACVDAVSGLLLTASLLLIPSGYKSGKAYAEIPTNGNGDLTWTRASTALRTNSSGLLESMGSGVPRLSYMYGSCPALLLEPQRTNLFLRSEEFANVVWTKSNLSITANTTTAPDGNTTADTLSVGVDASAGRHRLAQSVTLTIGTTYTGTYYLKANQHQWIQLVGVSGFSVNVWANFNLSTGVIGNTGGVDTTASIESVGNGWYRCRVSGVATGTTSTGMEVLVINNTNSGRYPSYQSTTAEDVCYVWGSQFEAVAYSTTYIPTTTASATRIADSFSRNNIYTNGLITSSGGTWFVELRGNVAYVRDSTAINLFLGDNITAPNNAFVIRTASSASTRLSLQKVVAGSFIILTTPSTDTLKIAFKWNGTSADVFVNGVKEISATAFTTTNMEFLSCIAQNPTFIQQMALYPEPKSDQFCIDLTTL
jgi:hypothetical protein